QGLEVLLDAIARTRDDAQPIRLRLWGEPPVGSGGRAGERYRATILARVDRLAIADRVDVAGPLAAEDVPARLGACDVVALPYEERRGSPGLASISSVAYDAYDAGTPIVASRVRALPELVDDGVDGVLVPPGDAGELATTLRALRDDPSRRRALRAGARARGQALGLDATGRAARAVYTDLPRSTGT
ncbi:MAG: glycosyltransferase, partial [Patulibacter sp.]